MHLLLDMAPQVCMYIFVVIMVNVIGMLIPSMPPKKILNMTDNEEFLAHRMRALVFPFITFLRMNEILCCFYILLF